MVKCFTTQPEFFHSNMDNIGIKRHESQFGDSFDKTEYKPQFPSYIKSHIQRMSMKVTKAWRRVCLGKPETKTRGNALLSASWSKSRLELSLRDVYEQSLSEVSVGEEEARRGASKHWQTAPWPRASLWVSVSHRKTSARYDDWQHDCQCHQFTKLENYAGFHTWREFLSQSSKALESSLSIILSSSKISR